MVNEQVFILAFVRQQSNVNEGDTGLSEFSPAIKRRVATYFTQCQKIHCEKIQRQKLIGRNCSVAKIYDENSC